METPSPQEVEAIVATLASALDAATASRYLTIAGVAMALYDMILTQADEVRLIWPTKTGVVKILYLLVKFGCRYYLLMDSLRLFTRIVG